MLNVLNPIWLFSVSAIIIPLIIHLWNVKKGRTLKVGSIRLLGESSRQSAKSLKLNDLLLLFLRCLLLIILAFILAKPFWNSINKAKINSTWVLIEEENSKEIYKNYKAQIDSLAGLGFDLRYFEPNFKEIKVGDLQINKKDTTNKNNQLSYWSLLNLFNDKIPDNTKAILFTGNQLNRLGTKRPEISFQLSWRTITPADSIGTWLENAWFKDSETIIANIAESRPMFTRYTHEIYNPTLKNSRLTLDFEQGRARLTYKDSKNKKGNSLLIDTASIKIAIYTDNFKTDANYLTAAIGAIQTYTSRNIELKQYSTKNIPTNQNIIFWLSELEIPSQITAINTIFTYKKGEVKNVNTILKLNQNSIETTVGLYKRIASPKNKVSTIPIWEDGFGNPILNRVTGEKYTKIEFYSRFNPDWNELVWSEELPKSLINIVLSKTSTSTSRSHDKRIVSNAQMFPSYVAKRIDSSEKNKSNTSDLENQFWLTLILIFMLERYLTFRNN